MTRLLNYLKRIWNDIDILDYFILMRIFFLQDWQGREKIYSSIVDFQKNIPIDFLSTKTIRKHLKKLQQKNIMQIKKIRGRKIMIISLSEKLIASVRAMRMQMEKEKNMHISAAKQGNTKTVTLVIPFRPKEKKK